MPPQIASNGQSHEYQQKELLLADNDCQDTLKKTSIVYVLVVTCTFVYVSLLVPEPYMDEVFHVDQARRYCVGNFNQWNTKITTPPGLYLITLGFLKPFSELYAFGEVEAEKVCPTSLLRFVNVLFAFGNAYLLFQVRSTLYPPSSKDEFCGTVMSSVSLSLFPILFFFNFLFYTDTGSLFFVLLMYFHHLNSQTWLASVFGLISLLFRQTNIVWLFFVAADHSIKVLQRNLDKIKKKVSRNRAIASTLQEILIPCFGYVIVGFLFVLFLVWNKGIVLGDRSAHEASFHLPQLLYFLGFSAIFGSPWLLRFQSLKSFTEYASHHWIKSLFLIPIIAIILQNFSTAHPYLLADNRHYTFYVWRRILNTDNPFRFILSPIIYYFCGWSFLQTLEKKNETWTFLFLLSTSISVVPQKLLEFRYFVIPFVIWRLNINPLPRKTVILELFLFLLIDAAVLYMFLKRPFKWTHEPSQLQRFIW